MKNVASTSFAFAFAFAFASRVMSPSVVLALGLALAPVACSGATSKVQPGDATPAGGDDTTGDSGSSEDAGGSGGDDGGTHLLPDGGQAPFDAGPRPVDGGPPGTTGVTIIVEPNGNNASELVAAIHAAKTSVHMTMYLLTSSQIIQALLDQHNAKVEVKVVLNQNFPDGMADNASAFSQLQSNGVDVVYAPAGFTYTHEKCVILDGKTAWIMTMNATNTSPKDNREYLAIDTDPTDVAEAEATFQADYANQSFTPTGPLVVAPVNARSKIVALAGSATRTLDVEGEEFSDTAVASALASAAKAGVKVRLVIATGTSASSNQAQAIATVKAAGVSVVGTGVPYIHAKAMVADGTSMYVGSENFSGGSLGYNRELGVIVTKATEVAKVAAAIETDFKAGKAQ
jgi:cardiolipin synthase